MSLFKTRLLTPGPTDVPPQVLEAMAKPIIHHRTKQYQQINAELNEQLQWLFRTEGPVLTIAGSGSTAFEASQISLAKPGSKVLAVAGGKFGERWQDVFDQYAKSLDLTPVRIDVPWGSAVTAAQIKEALAKDPEISLIALVHSETSTATACDIKAIAEVTRNSDALLLVDGITSVGTMPVEMDAWGIDALVTGSQKAMMLPPGLGFVGLGERALKRLDEVEAGPYFNLDLRKWVAGWKKNNPPFTPPVSLVIGQVAALNMLKERGLENVWGTSRKLADAVRAAFAAMNLKPISDSPSDSVTGAYYPSGVTDDIRKGTRDNHGIHMAGGQDGRGAKWKGKIFRVSHMGYVDAGDTLSALLAIEAEMAEMGHQFEKGAGIAAASKVLLG